MTIPSRRYCLACLKIYTVAVSTNIPVICSECTNKKSIIYALPGTNPINYVS